MTPPKKQWEKRKPFESKVDWKKRVELTISRVKTLKQYNKKRAKLKKEKLKAKALEQEQIQEIEVDIFKDISSNKKRAKTKKKNSYSLLTDLIKQYKKRKDEKIMLDIIKSLEGIINTFTIIITPGDPSQQIHLNPYMKKFIGMFLTKEEQVKTTYQTYMQAVYRIRWIMRYWTYEDLYSHMIAMIVDIVNKIEIVGTCDCFYYIQLVIKFKMHTLVANKTAKDITVDIKEMPMEFNSAYVNDEQEDKIDRFTFDAENLFYEDKLINNLYSDIDLTILNNNEDIFKYFSPYEKYIIYLNNYLEYQPNRISSLLENETTTSISEYISDIIWKIEQLGDN